MGMAMRDGARRQSAMLLLERESSQANHLPTSPSPSSPCSSSCSGCLGCFPCCVLIRENVATLSLHFCFNGSSGRLAGEQNRRCKLLKLKLTKREHCQHFATTTCQIFPTHTTIHTHTHTQHSFTHTEHSKQKS